MAVKERSCFALRHINYPLCSGVTISESWVQTFICKMRLYISYTSMALNFIDLMLFIFTGDLEEAHAAASKPAWVGGATQKFAVARKHSSTLCWQRRDRTSLVLPLLKAQVYESPGSKTAIQGSSNVDSAKPLPWLVAVGFGQNPPHRNICLCCCSSHVLVMN